MNKAIFLDRDGTINIDRNYLIEFSEFELIKGTIQALKLFQEKGYILFITSNQSGVARGFFTIEQVEQLNSQIRNFLKEQGITIEEITYCPHLEKGSVEKYSVTCECRKPGPGMIEYLQKKYDLDLEHSYAVGDKLRDAESGQSAGAMGILVRTGPTRYSPDEAPFPQFDSLLDFAKSL